jgi:hypothetical protein
MLSSPLIVFERSSGRDVRPMSNKRGGVHAVGDRPT